MKQLSTADINADEVSTADIDIDEVAIYLLILVWMK